MPRESPYRIVLTENEERELQRRAAKYTLPYFEVLRAKMILMAAQDMANDDIARSLATRREVVSQWRKRFFEKRLPGLEEHPRPGRPRAFSPSGGRDGQGVGM
jgi:hypothetical protein